MKTEAEILAGELINIDINSAADACKAGRLIGNAAMCRAHSVGDAFEIEVHTSFGKAGPQPVPITEEPLPIMSCVGLGIVNIELRAA